MRAWSLPARLVLALLSLILLVGCGEKIESDAAPTGESRAAAADPSETAASRAAQPAAADVPAPLPPAANIAPQDIARFARLALDCVGQEYPNKIGHTMQSDADVAPPRILHPAFHGCFDWHSSVHGHWLLARLVRLFPTASLATEARAALDRSLTPENIVTEAAYLRGEGRRSYERPYGLAWLLQLAAELREWDDPDARRWAANLRPLEDEAAERIATWLPKLRYPIRTGEHSQTAFALGVILDWARITGHKELAALVEQRARFYHAADRNCNLDFEPSGQDFLSPCLAEADLMRRILAPAEFATWLSAFLPEIPVAGQASERANWLPVAEVTDRSDGKLAHLDGLNLSRAWMLEGIAAGLPATDGRRRTLLAAAAAHRQAGLAAVTGEHYEGGHWLGSFATYLATRRGLQTDPLLATVQRLRQALNCDDLATAQACLAADPRVWWEQKKDAGNPWRLGGGRWRDWDEHFAASSRILAWDAPDDSTVSFLVEELNDYYRLTGRGPQHYRRYYFFDAGGRISGTMIKGEDSGDPTPSLFPQFEAWARLYHPVELQYLVPDGRLDPTGDRPPRMRALLQKWRATAGLPMLD